MFRDSDDALPSPWEGIFGPLRAGTVDELVVIAQIGQSLDGRIATVSGHSHYINGPDGLAHLHRLRALVDAVMVGVGTAIADDPQLTVRRVAGPNPARVLLDPNGRLKTGARMFAADGARRLVLTTAESHVVAPRGVEVVELPRTGDHVLPSTILNALAERGLRRILIEGGADTVSRFLMARCIDRLHVVVAPMILGSGRPGINLPPVERADQGLRTPVLVHKLGEEVLLDCDLSAHRVVVGRAKKST